ncbi:MAG TPA: DNA photolyase [Candidatus Marinimicrobia bacterium]|nr:DNA photolyase [Candidatus Neomarinimicrobiota bacterium]HRS51361.1 DNA photolyase [Candidatus Neomarinimicrobiota bacterium]HRU92267.1 DNA photolyase [Candidatus Neomarinimicrobiota bacterium]
MNLPADRLIKKIFVTAECAQDELTEQILDAYPILKKIEIESEKTLIETTPPEDPKKILLVTRSKGEVVKDCPGTSEPYLCCRYQVINQTLNCPLDCTYCILQYYLNQPATIIYTDYQKIITEIDQKIASQSQRLWRFGTGELGDSLALTASQIFAIKLMEYFAAQKNALLELKTKTDRIGLILAQPHNGHTVISWSLNPLIIRNSEERLAPPPARRLNAAAEAVRQGFLVGFHFDPIIDIPDWESQYLGLIEELYRCIDPARIAWISLGSLRFPPSMKAKIIERYPHSRLPYGELIRGQDQKLRYLRPRRTEIYRSIYRKLTEIPDPPFVYFCMESPTVWQDVCGFTPESNAHLDYLFAENLWRRFPGLVRERPRWEDY